jgi:hypothetical protein
MWCPPSSYKQLLRREGDKLNRRAPADLNDHTCTLVHRDVTDDLDATLALCHLHVSTGKQSEAQPEGPLQMRGPGYRGIHNGTFE